MLQLEWMLFLIKTENMFFQNSSMLMMAASTLILNQALTSDLRAENSSVINETGHLSSIFLIGECLEILDTVERP